MKTFNLDKVKISIGDVAFDHIATLGEQDLKRQRKELVDEISLTKFRYGKGIRYYQLLDEYFFINYRLGLNEQPLIQ